MKGHRVVCAFLIASFLSAAVPAAEAQVGPSVEVMAPLVPSSLASGQAGWDGTFAYTMVYSYWSSAQDRVVRYDPATDTASFGSPAPVWGGVFGFDGRYGYVVGGWNASGGSLAIHRYDPVGDTWFVRAATMPTFRDFGGSSMVWDGTVFTIVGMAGCSGPAFGCSATGQFAPSFIGDSTILRYDPAADTLTQSAHSIGLWAPAGFAAGGRTYILGGNSVQGPYGVWTPSRQVLEYDPVTDSLSLMPVLLPDHTWLMGATWDGTRAYLVAGAGPSYVGPSATSGSACLVLCGNIYLSPEILVFDPAAATLAAYPAAMPWPVVGSAVWVGPNAYVFGSSYTAPGPTQNVNTNVFCFPACTLPSTGSPSQGPTGGFEGQGVSAPPALCGPTCASVQASGMKPARPSDALDDDQDGVDDRADNCPSTPNQDQADADHDGVGDACLEASCMPALQRCASLTPTRIPQPILDSDLDGVMDVADNCPAIPNKDQQDLDHDQEGDACDMDMDGDGVADKGLPPGVHLDNCPRLHNPAQEDLDMDGQGDACIPVALAPRTATVRPAESPAKASHSPPLQGAGVMVFFAALAALVWRLRFGAIVLFSRLSRSSLLDQPARIGIAERVQAEPGIHFQALVRSLGMGRGIVRHHLDVLIAGGILVQRREGRYACYYLPGTGGDGAGLLKSPGARRLVAAIRATPGAILADAARAARLRPASAAYHVDRLAAVGLVERRPDGARVRLFPVSRPLDGDAGGGRPPTKTPKG